MSIDVHTEVMIRRSPAEVAAFMFDPRNDKLWTTGVVECRPLTEGPLRAGSRVERITQFLGRRFGYQYEVTDTQSEHFVQMRVEEPFPMQIRYQLEGTPEGTRASIRAQGTPPASSGWRHPCSASWCAATSPRTWSC